MSVDDAVKPLSAFCLRVGSADAFVFPLLLPPLLVSLPLVADFFACAMRCLLTLLAAARRSNGCDRSGAVADATRGLTAHGAPPKRPDGRPRPCLVHVRQTEKVDDLHVQPGPGAPRGLTVPAGELVEQFSRSSGPGGQGVNTTDSRVQLSIDLATTTALDDAQRRRALRRLAPRLAGTILAVSASEHRSQRQNRVAARERLGALLRDAVMPGVVRRATRPTRGSQRRRLEDKRRRAETKSGRRRPDSPE